MPHRYRVLVIVSVATFVASLDLFIVNIAFPSIKHDFAGSSDATLSWVLSAYAIVMAAHRADAPTKVIRPPMNKRFRPRRSARRPAGTRSAAMTIA